MKNKKLSCEKRSPTLIPFCRQFQKKTASFSDKKRRTKIIKQPFFVNFYYPKNSKKTAEKNTTKLPTSNSKLDKTFQTNHHLQSRIPENLKQSKTITLLSKTSQPTTVN